MDRTLCNGKADVQSIASFGIDEWELNSSGMCTVEPGVDGVPC